MEAHLDQLDVICVASAPRTLRDRLWLVQGIAAAIIREEAIAIAAHLGVELPRDHGGHGVVRRELHRWLEERLREPDREALTLEEAVRPADERIGGIRARWLQRRPEDRVLWERVSSAAEADAAIGLAVVLTWDRLREMLSPEGADRAFRPLLERLADGMSP